MTLLRKFGRCGILSVVLLAGGCAADGRRAALDARLDRLEQGIDDLNRRLDTLSADAMSPEDRQALDRAVAAAARAAEEAGRIAAEAAALAARMRAAGPAAAGE